MMRLLDCYIPVFTCVLRMIQQQVNHAEELRQTLLAALTQAQNKARLHGYGLQDIEEANFAVVVWADEAILCAGQKELSVWRQSSLQAELYDAELGGNTFFDRLAALVPDNYQVRLVYVFCLLSGFYGRYGKRDNLELHNIIQQELENLPDTLRRYISLENHRLMNTCDNLLENRRSNNKWHVKLILLMLSITLIYIFINVYLLNIGR
ncbi:DotU/TssL family secretion system protein [Photorhabdus thracensis]|uniref:DotU/TssL family secretion system protein n=1 Tax=Photorhabdus thracensis TaxID=230089 RepID=UPI001E58F11F|nr:DotU/TssL family secretion system protein [Photorhabdus thracensis]MCC8421336.1 DotU/TssL family secretion system protein [Photorhabdus thracensis]